MLNLITLRSAISYLERQGARRESLIIYVSEEDYISLKNIAEEHCIMFTDLDHLKELYSFEGIPLRIDDTIKIGWYIK